MNLKKLIITRIEYGEKRGTYKGSMAFDNELGEVALAITPEQCDRLFDVCAEAMVITAKEAARNLKVSVIEHAEAVALPEPDAEQKIEKEFNEE